MWDLPGPGIEPVFPALAGRFLTIAPPGKSFNTKFTLKKIKTDKDACSQVHERLKSPRCFCDHLEGWDGEGGREGDARGKRYGNICICITDSLCYKVETNTPL